MNCADWEGRVALYAGGELEDPESSAVAAHLALCAACAELERALRADRDRLAEPPEALQKVDFASMRRQIRAGILRDRRRARFVPFLAAAAALLATVGIGVNQRMDLPVEPLPALAGPAIPAASLRTTATPHRSRVAPAPSDAQLASALAALEEPPQPPPEAVRVPTRDPSVVILWIPGTKGDNHE